MRPIYSKLEFQIQKSIKRVQLGEADEDQPEEEKAGYELRANPNRFGLGKGTATAGDSDLDNLGESDTNDAPKRFANSEKLKDAAESNGARPGEGANKQVRRDEIRAKALMNNKFVTELEDEIHARPQMNRLKKNLGGYYDEDENALERMEEDAFTRYRYVILYLMEIGSLARTKRYGTPKSKN